MKWAHSLAVSAILLLATVSFAQDQSVNNPVRVAVPAAADLHTAAKLIDELHKSDISKATTPDQKSALALNLIDEANGEKTDMAGKYMLFKKAVDIACSGGDLSTAAKAINGLASSFNLNATALIAEAAKNAYKGLSPSADQEVFATQAELMANDAQAADEFELAKQLDDLALTVAKKINDPELVAEITSNSLQHSVGKTAFLRIKPSADLLRTKPDDAEANLAVGQYLCFFKSNWEQGLPMLSKGSDAKLKALAQADTAQPRDAAGQVAVGDGWWDEGSAQTGGVARHNCLMHASEWYTQANPSLTGLGKAKVEKRLQSLAEESPHLVVNLMKLVDVRQDARVGHWSLNESGLKSDGGDCSRIEFTYEPPEEYDYEVHFIRTSGNDAVDLVASVDGHQFNFSLGAGANKAYGLSGGATEEPGNVLTNNRRYTCLVKVRKTKVSAFLDGKLLSEAPTRDLKPDANSGLNHKSTLGLLTYRSPTNFISAQVTPVTGRGRVVTSGVGPRN